MLLHAGALHVKKWQLANGALYNDDKDTYFVFHDEKLDALVERSTARPGRSWSSTTSGMTSNVSSNGWPKEYGDHLVVEVLNTQASEDRWNRARSTCSVAPRVSRATG